MCACVYVGGWGVSTVIRGGQQRRSDPHGAGVIDGHELLGVNAGTELGTSARSIHTPETYILLIHSYSSRYVDLFILLPSLPLETSLRIIWDFKSFTKMRLHEE